MAKPSLWAALKEAGIEMDNHASDLYCPVTPTTQEILARYPTELANSRTFVSQIDGKPWYDVPFAYVPWWEARAPKAT